MKVEEIEIVGDARGIYGYISRVGWGSVRVRIRSDKAGMTALVSESDLTKLQLLDELEDLLQRAEDDEEFGDALRDLGVPIGAFSELQSFLAAPGLSDLPRLKQKALDAKFRKALEQLGVTVTFPTGEPLKEWERQPLLDAGAPPLSEQIIADRRQLAVYFLDASVIVKIYVEERGSDWLRNLVQPERADRLIVVRTSHAEVAAALYRRMRGAGLDLGWAEPLIRDLTADVERKFQVIEVDRNLVSVAVAVAHDHGLRGYDCIQLAAALTVSRARAGLGFGDFSLLTSDGELAAAAVAEGLVVEDPNTHQPAMPLAEVILFVDVQETAEKRM